MQSLICKRLFSYSVSRTIIIRAFYHADLSNEIKRSTLQHRFIKYLEESINVNNSLKMNGQLLITNKENGAASRRLVPLKQIPTNATELSFILEHIESLENVEDVQEIISQLELIDKRSCVMLAALSSKEILLLLNKLLEIIPLRVASLKFYSRSMKKLRYMLSEVSLNTEETVNLLFLASVTKTAGAQDVASVLKHLPDMSELPLMEQCIVSMATFKAGVKLERKDIQTIEDTVHSNLNTLMEEPGLFVCLLKALRYGGPSPEFSSAPISRKVLERKRAHEISIAVPILSLYAEMLKAEKRVLSRLVRDSISDIKTSNSREKSQPLSTVRMKDVDRLLWVASRLNYRLTEDQLAEIEQFIEIRLTSFSNNPKLFVNTLLSLWMLRSSKCRQNVEYCFQEKIFQPLLHASQEDQFKLNLLLECVRIEAPEIKIPPSYIRETNERSIKNCREVEAACELLKCFASHLALSDTEIDCPVWSLRLYGISARHPTLGWIHMDILNNITCLKDTRKPNGLMSLKLRLVKALGYRSILLDNDGVIGIEAMVATIEGRINSMLEKMGE